MQETFPLGARVGRRLTGLGALARSAAPSLTECVWALVSAVLLVISFPDFNLWPLAWVGLVPLLLVVLRRPRARQAFVLGWLCGTLYFYGSCYWLTYAMTHYGGIPAWLAYALLMPITLLVGLFPAAWACALARMSARRGAGVALVFAPLAWTALEWARLGVTGQLWNALGYSQAYVPTLVQPARWGGVYAVTCLLLTINAAVAYVLLRRDARALATLAAVAAAVSLVLVLGNRTQTFESREPRAVVVGVQPDVPMEPGRTKEQTSALVNQHLSLSATALRAWDDAHHESDAQTDTQTDAHGAQTATPAHLTPPPSLPPVPRPARLPRLVIWPESPMNFTYAQDAEFRSTVARFAREQRAFVLFNSQEPATGGGVYNSAVLVDEEGRQVAQYDKIRLLPFGEYVPLPRWLPAAWLLSGVVGDFTPGEKYPLMPLGDGAEDIRIGVFICFESAFPSIARTFAGEGADVLVNISNDGYLGRTAVLRQHLANVVLRAVENNRTVLRVTNTGITALVTPRGQVLDATESFEPAARIWTIARAPDGGTFYTRHGDIFAAACATLSLLVLLSTFKLGRRPIRQ